MSETYDYIIIGAGSAGCVLANRLSEDPATKVLVLEYGGSDKSIFIQMPTALSIPMNGTKYNWKYMTLPEPGLDGRQVQRRQDRPEQAVGPEPGRGPAQCRTRRAQERPPRPVHAGIPVRWIHSASQSAAVIS